MFYNSIPILKIFVSVIVYWKHGMALEPDCVANVIDKISTVKSWIYS